MSIKHIKITLFTNNLRGISCLEYLLKKKIYISNIVITKKNLDVSVKKYLIKHNFDFFLIKDIKDIKLKKILTFTDLGLVCGFPHIFQSYHFLKSKFGFINLHAGLLPKYRGGSPLNWQIIKNEKYFGLSIIKIDDGIDTGNIIIEKKFILKKKYTIEDLHRISNNEFPKLLYKSIFKILSSQKLKKQSRIKANYFRQRRPEDSFIIPEAMTITNLKLLIRATSNTYQPPYVLYNKKKIEILKFRISRLSLNFKKSNILIIENNVYIKLKDKLIEVIN